MSDQFNVTAAWDKPQGYNSGDKATATISGGDVLTTTQTSTTTVGPLTIPIIAADGASSTVNLPAVPVTVTKTVTTPESVVIDPSRAIVDNSPTPHTWVRSADGLSISATV